MRTIHAVPICSALALIGLIATLSVLPSLARAESAVEQVRGLWAYTGLTSAGGKSMPLTGIFLFQNGKFLQQSVFDGEPYFQQGVMATSGTYSALDRGLYVVAEQTLSLAPTGSVPLSSQGVTEHNLDVTRVAEGLTLVFGSGTVQTFKRMGDAVDATIVSLEHGAMALVNDHFIVVSGDDSHLVSGYGRYHRLGEHYFIDVIRWVESDGTSTLSARGAVMSVRFDGETLRLPGGRVLEVAYTD